MKITAVTIENFKGFKEPVTFKLKPITLLFGRNSAGKSTIIQALNFAREFFVNYNTAAEKSEIGGDVIDLGGFKNVVHKHDENLNIKMAFDLELETDCDLPRYNNVFSDFYVDDREIVDFDAIPLFVKKIKVICTVGKETPKRSSAKLLVYEIHINNNFFSSISDDGLIINNSHPNLQIQEYLNDTTIQPLDMGNFLKSDKVIVNAEEFYCLPLSSMDWEGGLKFDNLQWQHGVEPLVKADILEVLNCLVAGPGQVLRNMFQSFCYLGPMRQIPKRDYRPSSSTKYSDWSQGLAAYDILYGRERGFTDLVLLMNVNKWLSSKDKFNTHYALKIKSYRELEEKCISRIELRDKIISEEGFLSKKELAAKIKSRKEQMDEVSDIDIKSLPIKKRLVIKDMVNEIEVSPQDIGVGISQLLPVIVASYIDKEIIAIEQPELHLHPAAQTTLGDLFIDSVNKSKDSNKTFIVETHSEHLLLRILRRIRETADGSFPNPDYPIKPEDVSVLYVDFDSTGSTVLELPVNEDGEFDRPWPNGFFAERIEELF